MKECKIGERVLREFIREKINYKATPGKERLCKYDGFDMSGYGKAHFNNLELISRFSSYMVKDGVNEDDWRVSSFKIPIFWKGGWVMRTVGNMANDSTNDKDDWDSGQTTEDILLKTILANNPEITEDVKKFYYSSEAIKDKINLRIVDEI